MDEVKVDGHRESGLTRSHVDYPSNSHKRIVEAQTEKKVTKVITGKVTRQKKSFGKKFLETFIVDSIPNVASYVLYDVLIPAAKSTLYDMVKGSFEMALFSEKKDPRIRRDSGRSYVSYNSVSRERENTRRRPEPEPRNRHRHNYDNIVIPTKAEAEEVLSHLVDLVIDYGQATVADLHDLVGITQEYTDRSYGWLDLRSASVSRSRYGDGYLLNLPKVIILD